MRWLLLGYVLLLTVLVCGCVQSPSGTPATPVIPSAAPAAPLTPVTTHPVMEVTVNAVETPDAVVIKVTGGKDAPALAALDVRIDNFDGTVIERTIPHPVAGELYRIEYYHMANAATINIVGTFSDGFRQTLLLTQVQQGA